jgi:CBS domain-containing protein
MTTVQSFLQTHAQPALTVNINDNLAKTARSFSETVGGRKYSLAVVIDDEGRPVGVIGLGDIVYAFGQEEAAASKLLVKDVMTPRMITAGLDDEIHDLLRQMAESEIRHMPIVSDGKLIALLSRRDALEFLHDSELLELEQLRGFVFRSGARY